MMETNLAAMEVTKANCEETLEKMRQSLQSAVFVAVDTEFTGILNQRDSPFSGFNTPGERYLTLKPTIDRFTLCQIGVAVFHHNVEKNEYYAEVFNMFVIPGSLCADSDMGHFSLQSSAVDFLCRNHFDFNKCFYEGIQFMNDPQIHQMKKKLIAGEHNVNDVDENQMRNISTQLIEWISKYGDETIELDIMQTGLRKLVFCYVIQKEFPMLLVESNSLSTGDVKFRKTSDTASVTANQEKILLSICAELSVCTRMMELLSISGLPLIGHNLMFDLMFLWDKLLQPMPKDYEKFKRLVHQYFPTIFDTKPIALHLREALIQRGLSSFGLNDIYHFLFKSDNGRYFKPCQPAARGAYENSDRPHEAGYDAFISGAVFVRLAHITATIDKLSTEIEPLSSEDLFKAVAIHRNKVQISRATVPFIILDGDDPAPERLERLIATSRWFQTLDKSRLAQWLSAYGRVELQNYTRRSALITVSTLGRAKEILRNGNQPSFKVEIFKPWWHGKTVNRLFWITATTSSVLMIVGLSYKLSRSRGRNI